MSTAPTPPAAPVAIYQTPDHGAWFRRPVAGPRPRPSASGAADSFSYDGACPAGWRQQCGRVVFVRRSTSDGTADTRATGSIARRRRRVRGAARLRTASCLLYEIAPSTSHRNLEIRSFTVGREVSDQSAQVLHQGRRLAARHGPDKEGLQRRDVWLPGPTLRGRDVGSCLEAKRGGCALTAG